MRKFLKALGIGCLYFAIFMGIQIFTTLAGTLMILGSLIIRRGVAFFCNVEMFHRALMECLLRNMTFLVLISNLLTLLGFFTYFHFRHQKFFQVIGLRKTTVKNISLSALFGAGLCFFMDLVTALLPIPEPVMESFELQHGMLWFGDAGMTFLSVALIGPISEEVCFRGLCYGSFKKGMPSWAAAILSSLLFGTAHGDPVWFFIGFLAGIFLSWVYEITGSLLCAIAVHVINNAISSITAYFPVTERVHSFLVLSGVILAVLAGISLYREKQKQTEADTSSL